MINNKPKTFNHDFSHLSFNTTLQKSRENYPRPTDSFLMWIEKVGVLDKAGHFDAGDRLEAAQGEIGLVPSHSLHRLNLQLVGEGAALKTDLTSSPVI